MFANMIRCIKGKNEKTVRVKDKIMKINYYNKNEDRWSIQRRAMFNSMGNRCICGKQACFNYPSMRKGICCKKCKKEGMINVRK